MPGCGHVRRAARATGETVRHGRQWPRCAAQVGVGVGLGLGRELGLGLRGRRSKGRCTFARRRWCRGAVRASVQLGRASERLTKGTRRMSCTAQAATGRAAGAGLGVRGRRAAAGGCRRTARAASRRRGSREERCARERLARRERGPAVWAGGGVSGAPQAAFVRQGQHWRGGRTCRRVSGWSGARPSSLRTATQPSLSAERAHPAAGFDRSGGHSRVRVARCRARLGRSSLETFAARRERRRHRLGDAAAHALSAAKQRRVPQGGRALAVREIASRRARGRSAPRWRCWRVRRYPATRHAVVDP